MKKIVLWIAGIVLGIIVLAVALGVWNAYFSNGTHVSPAWDSGYNDSLMAPAPESAMQGRASVPGSSVSKTAYDSSGSGQPEERLVIRSAQISIVSQEVKQAAEALKRYAQANGGFVVSAQVWSEEGSPPSAQVSFRIPADKLDATVAFVRSQAVRVASESVTGEDVTEEYVDISAKLKNLEASEEQLRAIMKDAKKTEDVLAVHRELTRVRGEIDALAGRKKYLEQSAALSSVTVAIATDEASLPVVESGDQWRPLVVAKGAVAAFLGVVRFLANFAIWAVIFVPLWGTAYLAVRYWRRRRL